MQDVLTRFLENLAGRMRGQMNFRIVVQPLVAAIFAIRDGREDAHDDRPPYFWALFAGLEHRRDLLRTGWKSVGRIFVVAVLIDVVYQVRELHWFYPGEALMVALLLAVVPYVLLRGPANRLTRWRPRKKLHS
jgi:peptidoglycan/LPS O-acetylase OafA/YrhL